MAHAALVPSLALCLAAGHALAVPSHRLVVFVHDQSTDQILRLQDLNADGDAHDPGEVTLFFDDTLPVTGVDNAQGLAALDPWTLLATDNFAPDNIVLLQDLDRNGDAFGPGENTVWFDGTLPIGITMANPVELRRRAGGGFFLVDNNTLDTTRPEAIYRLDDADASGTIDPGEIVTHFVLSPIGVSAATTLDVVEDTAGNLYTIDITDPNQIESIDIINAAATTRTEWMSSQTLFNLRNWVLGSTYELEYIPLRNEVLFGAFTLASDQLILAARDNNGSGTINVASEIRVVWSETGHADGFSTGSPRDFARTPDGRLLWVDALNDRVMLHIDLNGDNDYQDTGETTVFFDAAIAAANGLPSLTLPLSLAVALTCPCDAEPDGVLNLDDVDAFIAGFAAQNAVGDCDGNGMWNVDDVDCFVACFQAGCP